MKPSGFNQGGVYPTHLMISNGFPEVLTLNPVTGFKFPPSWYHETLETHRNSFKPKQSQLNFY